MKICDRSESDKLADVNTERINVIALSSPSIVEGVDRTTKEFTGENTINMEQVKQQICQNRNIKEGFVSFCNLHNNVYFSSYILICINITLKIHLI